MAASRSELRLFVGVDIAGSTALKNRQNYSYLVKLHTENKKLLDGAKERLLGLCPSVSRAAVDSVHDEVLSAHLPSEADLDWAAMLQQCFSDFHSIFRRNLGNTKELVETDHYPWKALGDELIYSFRVRSRTIVQRVLVSFLAALREYDKKLSQKDRIRLKSSAWVAGFPIRNRQVQLPMAKLRLDHDLDEDGNAGNYPYPRIDFLGPDMDTGFRLGKCTWPSLCVVSIELAQLLGECQTKSQVRLRHVGWEKMKGVWDDRPYPILWAALPPEHPQAEPYNEIKIWSEGESEFVRAWKTQPLKEAKAHLELIKNVREQLPPEFGIVPAYIVDDGDKIPEQHRLIQKILEANTESVDGTQTTPAVATSQPPSLDADAIQRVVRDVQEVVREKLTPLTLDDNKPRE